MKSEHTVNSDVKFMVFTWDGETIANSMPSIPSSQSAFPCAMVDQHLSNHDFRFLSLIPE